MTAMNEEAMQISDVSGLWMMDGGRMHVAFQKDAPGSATIEMRADQQCVVTVQEDGRLLARFVSTRPANEEAMRAAFEKWLREEHPGYPLDKCINEDMYYSSAGTRHAWLGYQAALTAQSAEVELLRSQVAMYQQQRADWKAAYDQSQQSIAELRAQSAEVERLQKELAQWEKLKDPIALHANLLRGIPSQLTREQLLHLAGVDELRAQVEAMRKALQKVGDTAVYVDHGECSVSMDVIREVDAALAQQKGGA